jgi:hypothetical protein
MSFLNAYAQNFSKAAEPEFLPGSMIFTKSYPGKNGNEKAISGFRFHSYIYNLATVFQDVGGETFGNKGRRRVLKKREGESPRSEWTPIIFSPSKGKKN